MTTETTDAARFIPLLMCTLVPACIAHLVLGALLMLPAGLTAAIFFSAIAAGANLIVLSVLTYFIADGVRRTAIARIRYVGCALTGVVAYLPVESLFNGNTFGPAEVLAMTVVALSAAILMIQWNRLPIRHSCRSCGYSRAGINGSTCPECGAFN